MNPSLEIEFHKKKNYTSNSVFKEGLIFNTADPYVGRYYNFQKCK